MPVVRAGFALPLGVNRTDEPCGRGATGLAFLAGGLATLLTVMRLLRSPTAGIDYGFVSGPGCGVVFGRCLLT